MSDTEKIIARACCAKGTGCGNCFGCCQKAVEYVVIDSFVWPPWPDKSSDTGGK